MKTGFGSKMQIGLAIIATTVLGVGCSTTSSTRATALKPTIGTDVDLSKFQVASVIPFDTAGEKQIDGSIGAKFSEDVATRLQYDFGSLFREVRKGTPTGEEDELIVTGTIRAYKPGSRSARFMFIPLGAASFKGELILKNAKDNRVLYRAPFDKLWAWGGMMGATKGIEDMVSESAAAVASTVAHAKGWKPSPTLVTAR